jgi:hypothetical protein
MPTNTQGLARLLSSLDAKALRLEALDLSYNHASASLAAGGDPGVEAELRSVAEALGREVREHCVEGWLCIIAGGAWKACMGSGATP